MGGQREIITFIILVNLILFVFIIGMVYFVSQFRKRKILYEKELAHIKMEYEKAKLQVEVDAQKETMKKIGKEIHDSVGQKLTLASIYLKKNGVSSGNYLGNNISEISELIDESLTELRQLSRTLVNAERYQTRLQDLILLETKRIQNMNGIRVEVEQNGEFDLDEDAKHNIHRIIQEFLQNSVKHAQCSQIKIDLNYEENQLQVKCSDNGVGFDLQKSNGPGVGISNMKKRVNDIKGRAEFLSRKGEGTQFTFFVPY
ncbi:sensor histidine kinase [Leadbetterella sp. DM7]|uniref:sensor histidine kinase n=1 Tax=Leadbetterella sp. DM7 TaxID=3235085 RepID=UPI00349E88CA